MLIWETPSADPKEIERVAARSSGSAECLRRDDGKGGLVLCEQGKAPRGVAEWRATRLFSLGRPGPEAGPWVFMVGIWTPEEWREELCAWYQCEHGPMLLECHAWQGFQFLESPAGEGCQFHVLHRLADRSVLQSAARKRSRSTPWFHRLAKNKWFDGAFQRVLAQRTNLVWHPNGRRSA